MSYGWQDHPALRDVDVRDPRSWQCDDPQVYTRRDLDEIDQCDVVIAFMCPKNPSGYGLSVELGYAFAMEKRVLFVDQMQGDWRSRYFDMHRCMSETFSTLDEAVAAL